MTDLIARRARRSHRLAMAQKTTLDVTRMPRPVRHPRIFEVFDALAVGESLVLANDHYPLPLLVELLAARPNQFDWSVLDKGAIFRVAITKRDERAPRGVDEYLSWDHVRLDALLDETIDLFEAARVADARKTFGEFACGLERHIEAEENIVFPIFDAARPGAGPTQMMRFEHVHIRDALRELGAALDRSDATEFDSALETLVSVLGEHNAKEEGVLYPAIDRMVDEEGRANLVRQMQLAAP
jgi:uncharacterized protein (DUF2249 family)/hemerythrin-like domain-containing protein